MSDTTNTPGFNRRSFIAGAAGSAMLPLTARAEAPAAERPSAQDPSRPVDVTLRVNGQTRPLKLDPRTTVLDALREHLGLPGSKKGCDQGQCGYCTPGQIMSAIACVREGHATHDDDIREYMSGNLCRCAAYPNIVAAVKQAAPEILKG